MAAQKGRDLLLKIEDDTGIFVTVAGLRTQRFALNADPVDVTNQESAGRWRELLGGAGVRRASVAGSGVFKDGASDTLIRQTFFDGLIRNWQIVAPSFGIIQGAFQISSLDYRGEHSGEVTFELSLESAGLLTFTAL
jgi:TP901-1 family phage major tail protein